MALHAAQVGLSASWAELIDQELADYDPVDKDAYRRLQERTKAASFINFDEVYEYLAVERYAVRVASGQYTRRSSLSPARRSKEPHHVQEPYQKSCPRAEARPALPVRS